MKQIPTKIPDVVRIEPVRFYDDRGYFFEAFSQKTFSNLGLPDVFVQDNQSRSCKGTLRGLHYQTDPFAQGKLVQVVNGEIFDVAVDIRPQSPTYCQWVGMWLDADSGSLLYIPPGFAHGFYVVSDTADVLYKCTAPYSKAHEQSILWSDPTLNIQWPLLDGVAVLLSEKDQKAPVIDTK